MFTTWINNNRDQIIEGTQGVLRIDSVGTSAAGEGKPFGQGCADALDYVLRLGQELGFTVKNVDGYAGHIEFGEGDDYIAVLGHLDVVPAGSGWNYPPFGAQIHDGKIYARGAIDDKGPMMAALYGLKAVKESGLPLKTKVRLIFGLDEESNWNCVKHYFSKEPLPIGGFTPDADFPLIYAEKGLMIFDIEKKRKGAGSASVHVRELQGGERPNMVADSARAVLTVQGDAPAVADLLRTRAAARNIEADVELSGQEITLRVKGVSAHGSTPFQGVNAVSAAGQLLAELDTNDRDLWQFLADFDWEGKRIGLGMSCAATGKLTANLGLANIDENEFVLKVNVRYPVDKTEEEILALSNAKLNQDGFEAIDRGDFNMKPHYVPKDSKIVETLLGVYREQTGDTREPLTTGGGTYARAVPNAVAFGALFPGDEELFHQPNECWPVENLLRCTEIYAKAIYELAK